MQRRGGFTLIELILSMLLLVIGTAWAASALEPIQAMARTRRAMTNQMETPRRVLSEYSQTAGSLVIGTPVVTTYDSVQVSALRIVNTQLSTVPRVQFILTDLHKASGARPDTFAVDFHPQLTQVGLPNLGDRRP